MELLLEPNLAARPKLLLAVIEEGAELVIAEVLADSLHEDHIVFGPPDNLTEVQGIAFVCLTDFDAWLFFGVLHIVRVAIHDVNRGIWEVAAQSGSNPGATAAKVKECSSSLAPLASGANCFDSSH